MAPFAVITKVTGHPTFEMAGDLRYLCEPLSRGNWQFQPLSPEEIQYLISKHRRLFFAEPGGKIIRLPAETIRVRGKDGIIRERRTGTISEAYAAASRELLAQGKIVFQRVVVGIKPVATNHGYHLAEPHGAVVPLTPTALIKARELGWTSTMEPTAARSILSRVIRESIKPHALTRRAVRTMTSSKKVGRAVAAHNLTVAPHPRILEQIRRAGQPVDKLLETAARRAIEKMERKIGAKITAVASTHLQDSTVIRPHLHVRLSAYDSHGKYIRLFDRKAGGSGGGRCVLQDDIEREIKRSIERDERRERD